MVHKVDTDFCFLPPVAFYGMSQEERIEKLFNAYKLMSENYAERAVLDGKHKTKEEALKYAISLLDKDHEAIKE